MTRAGCRVSAVCPRRGHPLLKTHCVERIFPYSGTDPIGSLSAAVQAESPQLIVPCDDRAVAHLHELHARTPALAELIERSIGAPASYPVVSARYPLLELARGEGARVPHTQLVDSVNDLRSWAGEQQLPWVLKADGTWGGLGVRMVHSAGESEEVLSQIARPLSAAQAVKRAVVNRDPFPLRSWRTHARPAVIVQEYIQGRPANCAVACWKGELVAGIAVEVVIAQGATKPAAVVRVVDYPEMIEVAGRLARRLGMSGFFGLDFMIEEKSETLYLIEMNPRCTPLSHLPLGKGRDLITALVAQLRGKPSTETAAVTQNDLIAYFPQAWQWNQNADIVESSFQDVPADEPELVEELLRLPWPDRSLLARLSDRLRRQTFAERASQAVVYRAALGERHHPECRRP